MGYIIYLDDIRFPDGGAYFEGNKNICLARSFKHFQAIIESEGIPLFVSFDFDLGLDEDGTNVAPTGGTCVRWMIEYCHVNNERFPHWRLHTANTEGRKEMQSLILSAFKAGYILP